MQYAVFHVRVKTKSWVIWLHPKEGIEKFAGEIPDDITKSLKNEDTEPSPLTSKDSSDEQNTAINDDKNS